YGFQGEYVKAADYLRKALQMDQQLYRTKNYPRGHPHLAASLNNLGALYRFQGEYGKAAEFYRQSLQMFQQLYPPEDYPKGHPYVAARLNNLGFLYQSEGEYGKAAEFYQKALRMQQQLTEAFTDGAAEAEALNYLTSLPLMRDALLTV